MESARLQKLFLAFHRNHFFVFLQKLVLKSLASMKVGVLGKKGYLSVALQIASPLTNKLSTANTVSFQGPRYPWFSSGICVFLATSQLRRRLGLLRCTVGPMFPLNYHSISSQSSDSASDIQCWGSPFFRSLDMSPLKGQASHSFIVPCLIQNCRMVYTMQKGCIGPVNLAVLEDFEQQMAASQHCTNWCKLFKQIYVHHSSNLSTFIDHSHFPSFFQQPFYVSRACQESTGEEGKGRSPQ